MKKNIFFVMFLTILIVLVLRSNVFSQTLTQTLNLEPGFNFISLTLMPSVTISALKTQYPIIEDIYMFNASAGSFSSLNEGTLTTLNAGAGYIIKASSSGIVSIGGASLSTVGNISLKKGFNLVGFSKINETIKFSELMTKFSSIVGVYKWNAPSSAFIQVIRKHDNSTELLDGVDPTITLAQSYFINMTSEAELNYDSSSVSIGPPGGSTPPGGVTPPGGTTPPGGGATTEVSFGTSAYILDGSTATQDSREITVSANDRSAVQVTNNGKLTLTNSVIYTSANTSSMDNSSFYGLNAAVLAINGGVITFSNSTVKTVGSGANGVFAYGSGSKIDMSDLKIECVATGAHGVDATGGAALTMKNVDITTAGNGAAAAIATDRGGGTISVEGGTVVTTGTKSPGIYSTGTITATGTKITTTASEGITIEGLNNVTMNNCTINAGKNDGVFIYQSFSGDASVGTGNFTMNGGTMTVEEGPIFYSTNTTGNITLNNAEITSKSGILLKANADQWGTSGSNGSMVSLTGDNERITGSVILDNISSAALIFKNASIYAGAINSENTAKSVSLSLDATSVWNVAGTSYLSALADSDSTLANINSNKNTIYYDSSNSANVWLGGKTYTLTGGGTLAPIVK